MGEMMLWDLFCEDTNEHGLPPGFRFHPTDEELITFYLASKVYNGGFSGVQIEEVDLNRCEPWELPATAKMGEREWYFYSLKDRKYPTGLRTNRATGAGYWKATGKDREVFSASSGALLGMKKTLVFYRGRAPRGEKTKWVLHEYRLDGDFSSLHACKEEWVICRVFHKGGGEMRNLFFQNHSYFLEPSSSTTTTTAPFLPPLMELQQALDQNPIQTLLRNNPCYTHHLNSNHQYNVSPPPPPLPPPIVAPSLPETFSPANIPSLALKSNPNHCYPLQKETIPIPKQCNVHVVVSDPLPHPDDEAVFNWAAEYSTVNPQNPFVFDVGLFGPPSSVCSGGAVHDMMPLLVPPPTVAAAESSGPVLFP